MGVALFAAWCGSLHGGAGALGAWTGHGVVLAAGVAVVLGGAGAWRDPWGLAAAGTGRRFLGLLPWLLAIVVLLAWLASPVRRAGLVGVVLLPAWFLVPAAVAAAWRRPAARRLGARAVAVVVIVAGAWSVGAWLAGASPRPALPLGHHNVLAAWLVVLLPVALLPAREPGRLGPALALLAALVGGGAVVVSRSLSGVAALAVVAGGGALVARWRRNDRNDDPDDPARRSRWRLALVLTLGLALAAVLAAVVVLQAPRLAGIARGDDPSVAARTVYWRAGWEGTLTRPWLGHGPGSTAWTLADHAAPVPGLSPPGEVVGELHLLPLAVVYELGVVGGLLALLALGLFARARLRDARRALNDLGDPAWVDAGLLGLLAALVAGCGTADWRLTALPLAVAVTAGAALAGGGRGQAPDGDLPRRPRAVVAGAALVYGVGALVVLAPLALAHGSWDRALERGSQGRDGEARAHLALAVDRDPGFPLYRARLAWPAGDGAAALEAARDAESVAALWLAVGTLPAERPTAGLDRFAVLGALERAGHLDPLLPFAPFHEATTRVQARSRGVASGPPAPDELEAMLLARALAAEPRLGAAAWFDDHPAHLAAALERLARTEGIDAGWRQAVVDAIPAARAAMDRAAMDRIRSAQPDLAPLTLSLDAVPATALSLHAFRRRPAPTRLAGVSVHRPVAEALGVLPPAALLATTGPEVFATPGRATGGAEGER